MRKNYGITDIIVTSTQIESKLRVFFLRRKKEERLTCVILKSFRRVFGSPRLLLHTPFP